MRAKKFTAAELGARGGRKRWEGVDPEERSRAMKVVAQKRWGDGYEADKARLIRLVSKRGGGPYRFFELFQNRDVNMTAMDERRLQEFLLFIGWKKTQTFEWFAPTDWVL